VWRNNCNRVEVLINTVLLCEASKKVEAVSQHYVFMMYKTTKKLGIIDMTEMTRSFWKRIIKNNVLIQR